MGVKGGLHTTGAKWFMIESQRHSYHLVDPSPWPISGSLGALATTVGGVMYMHSFQGGATLLSLGLIFILYTMVLSVLSSPALVSGLMVARAKNPVHSVLFLIPVSNLNKIVFGNRVILIKAAFSLDSIFN